MRWSATDLEVWGRQRRRVGRRSKGWRWLAERGLGWGGEYPMLLLLVAPPWPLCLPLSSSCFCAESEPTGQECLISLVLVLSRGGDRPLAPRPMLLSVAHAISPASAVPPQLPRRRLLVRPARCAGFVGPAVESAATVSSSRGGDSLAICRVLKGMWQTSGGWGRIDRAGAVDAMLAYADAGLSTFDLADHYEPAEDLYGMFINRVRRERPPEILEEIKGTMIVKPQLGRCQPYAIVCRVARPSVRSAIAPPVYPACVTCFLFVEEPNGDNLD
ncbi:uncharacterized protein LOC100844403 isoform X2 [Brachypodium distachyon]|uniref:uncharacterized protein LOC100844403 isoform X2 n=1 Tax=Brachypodium distachyon TaxID=15368 RepID=UPI00052FEA58|nr:uncharacterized protein LOC100844403 isoform X2 [Brachypodium distachyon]|eukprot:XP_024319418.1 uncharacterized protein LOC100844403 isoform X2 [Brachypodium distachyon]